MYSKNINDHLKHLNQVFHILKENKICMNKENQYFPFPKSRI